MDNETFSGFGFSNTTPAITLSPAEEAASSGGAMRAQPDGFGDFEGFLLDTEDGERKFFNREKEIEELAERAWRERLRIAVWTERDEPHRPLSIIIRLRGRCRLARRCLPCARSGPHR